MSGFEAGGVISLVSAVISLLEAAKTIYDGAHNAKGLPDTFAKVAENIPVVVKILDNIEKRVKSLSERVTGEFDTANKQELEDAAKSVRPIINTCQGNAEDLKEIFEKVFSDSDSSWLQRYKSAIRSLRPGRQQKVEDLMKEILEKLALLHTNDYFEAVVSAEDLRSAIAQLEEADPSLPSGTTIIFNGPGPINANLSSGTQYNQNSSGDHNTTHNHYGRPL